MSDFIDATQSYSAIEDDLTTINTASNDDLLEIPSTSEANSLIKLVNNPVNGVNNLYILQANPAGEIRFLTKDAYANNDVGTAQPYNVKIDTNGKLYLYYTYNFITNPIYFSGWKDIMTDVAQGFRDINLLEAGLAVVEGQQLISAGNIATLFTTTGELTVAVNLHTTQITNLQSITGTLTTNVAGIDGRLLLVEGTSTAYTTLFDNLASIGTGPRAMIGWKGRSPCRKAFAQLRNIYKPSPTSAVASQANQPAGQALTTYAERVVSQGRIIAPAVQHAGTVGQVAVVAGRKALDGIALALVGASVAGGAIALYNYYDRDADDGDANVIISLYDYKAGLYQDSLKSAGDATKLSILPYQIHKNGLSISAGTNTGFTTAGLYEYFDDASYPEMYITIKITTGLVAEIVNVATSGSKIWVVGDTINIPKSAIGGTSGNLTITVNTIYTATQIVDLQIAETEARIGTRRRRMTRRDDVVSYNDIDTTKLTYLTDTQAYTNVEDTGETLTYKKLTSRLNLLPTGTSDVDVYTSTGQVGIGTAPATKLHTYHATNNILRLETGTTGTNSIEFRRGTATDAFTDYRLISDTGVFRLQYENNLLSYGTTGTELINSTTTLISIFKNTSFSGNVGINAQPHATYKLDVAGDINISTGSLFRVNGLEYKPSTATLADTASDLAIGSILGTGKGGTGTNTHIAGNVLLGNGSGALTSATGLNYVSGTTTFNAPIVNVPTGGKYKINSVDLALSDLTGTLAIGKGGTGATSFTADGLLIGNGTTALTQNAGLFYTTATSRLTAPNVNVPTGGKYKINGVDLALSDLTGTLAVGSGGTGATSFTANGLMLGNGTTALTQNAGLFYTTATSLLTAPNVNVPTGGKYKINGVDLSYNDLTNKLTPLAGGGITINANNEISSAVGTTYTGGNGITITGASIAVSGTITQLITTGSIDMFILQNNATNSLRFKQNFIATNDFSYNLIQKNNNVDYPAFTFRNGQVAVGTTNVPTYALDVAGDINITGDIRRLSGLYKPAGAVLADTATDLATGVILSVAKGGTGANTFTATGLIAGNGTSALQTYAGLTYTSGTTTLNTPKIAVSGTSTLTGNVGVGTTPSATAKLDVLGDVNIVGKTTQKGNIECLTLSPATPTIPTALTIIPTPTSTFTPSSTITRCAILTYQGSGTETTYSVAIPAGGMLCDILMVGGGGYGGRDIGAGGGGGAVLYATDVLLKQDTYMVSVGRGAIFGSGEAKGQSTTGFGATLLGGGSAGDTNWNNATYANDGGSGAGGKGVSDAWSNRGGRPIVGGSRKGGILSDGTLYEGKVGGYGITQNNNQVVSAGGGGANAVGGNGQTSTGGGGSAVGASGGAGISNNILDATYFWGGGGGGGSYNYTTPTNGGAGGGGAGTNNNGGGTTATGSNGASSFFAVGTTINGINGTGGGGGGVGYQSFTAGSGGAGVIIIRYKLPTNHNETISFLPTGTNATTTFKEGIIGANYKIEASVSSIIVDAFAVDAITATTHIKNSGLVVKSSTNDTLITNNCGIGIDPTSTYKLNVNGDLNVNGTIWQNGFSVNAGFQQYRTFNFTYTGDTNFLLTTRARYCNIICWCSTGTGYIVSNGSQMAVNEFRGSLGFNSILNGVNNYFFYWTMQGDTPRPYKAWFGNGNSTTFTFLEMWYN